jgi:hypothetical protein
MPNWVLNRLTLTGDERQIVACVAAATDENNEIDFCRLRPMPRELQETLSPPEIVSPEEYERRIQEPAPCGHPITQGMSDELIARFGANNWNDWQCRNWGVKSALCEFDRIEGGEWAFFSDVPWSPVDALWQFISAQYPLVTFTTELYDEQLNCSRKIQYRAGETILEIVFHEPRWPILPWNLDEGSWSEFREFDEDDDQGEIDWRYGF